MTPATLVSGAGASPWEAALVGGLLARHSGVQVLARCFDVAQVLAAAKRVRPDIVLVGHDLDALDREVVAQLAARCRAVVGAYPPGDPIAVRRLIDIGCQRAVPHDLDPLDLARLVLELAGHDVPPREEDSSADRGHLVAVWGPTGAPGRTTVAAGIACALSSRGLEVLLVDADTYGASVAQSLGLSEQPSIVSAVRGVAAARLEAGELRALCQSAGGGLAVLSGCISGLWPEIREASLRSVLDAARSEFSVVVADVGFCIEEDEELSYNGAPLRRNLASRTVLREASMIVGVCRADPVGMRRYLTEHSLLRDVSGAPVVTVVNRSPASVSGRKKMEMSLAIERGAGAPAACFVPEDSSVVQSLWDGECVVRARPRSPAARALGALALEIERRVAR